MAFLLKKLEIIVKLFLEKKEERKYVACSRSSTHSNEAQQNER